MRTAVWKAPVAGRVRAGRLNLEGDGQGDLAGHGGEQRAVFVYQSDSYRYWEKELGRADLVHGNFGENFTVDGLPDDETCIGDRYRIGSAVFEVTQPRVTCYRVGIRMREPRMAALLTGDAAPDTTEGPLVSFARSGLAVRAGSARYRSLLELAEACDVPVRWACRNGVCHNCESGILSGSMTCTLEPLERPAEGQVLICCSRPEGDVVLDL